MLVMKENQRLYPSSWMYNASQIMTELAKIVQNHGGKVKPQNTAIISDRNVTGSEPITVTHTSYISFVLDDIKYYYQIDENPFFAFYYQKTPIKHGKYSLDAYLEEDKKEWLYDCFLKSGCAKADIVEGANLIFNMLMNVKNSGISVTSHRQRVPNTYDHGYHYENIREKERIGEIDF